jgi:hypothetical protein
LSQIFRLAQLLGPGANSSLVGNDRYGMSRDELLAPVRPLGHVFNDGPKPTGQRLHGFYIA